MNEKLLRKFLEESIKRAEQKVKTITRKEDDYRRGLKEGGIMANRLVLAILKQMEEI